MNRRPALFFFSLLVAAVAILSRAGDSLQAAASAGDDAPVRYRVILDAPQTQMVTIELHIPAVEGDVIDFHLPVWRPGKYLVIDPAGTVRDVTARTMTGRGVPIEKIRKSAWRISPNPGTPITVRYRVYANSLGDRTRHVDDTHAFLSGSSVFLFAEALRFAPLEVHIDAPEGWKIASGLEFAPGSDTVLIAPNYDVLADSPIEIGEHDFIRFEALGKPHDIVIWGEGEFDAERLVDDFRDIVEVQHDVFGGELPYERYVFLIHAGRNAGGGTEHLNSTIMQTSKASLEGSLSSNSAYHRFLGLVAHEFFHIWNVKRLRPAGLQPYDYERENYTDLLWVAEGTTSYYDDLTLARTGVYSADRYIDVLANAINGLQGRPGRLVQSLADSSFDAWIKFNRSTPDDVNSTISFYSKGALVSLLLDMEVRRATGNAVTLDTVMREMYERFPLEGGGFTTADLMAVIEELTGKDIEPFFAAYVRGTEELDYAKALEVVGLEPHFRANSRERDADREDASGAPALPRRATLGIALTGTTVRSVESSGPAYAAGIMPGDELVALNRRRITSSSVLSDLISEFDPGDEVTLLYFRHDELRELTVALGGEPDGRWTIRRIKEPTAEQKAAYYTWLRHPWPGEKPPGENNEEEEKPDRAEGG